MLTQNTARSLAVNDRTDPEQSIRGRAAYIAKMRGRIPSFIKGSDRIYMAMAAYNIGFAHLTGARQIAVRKHRDPNSWYDVKESLPLLTQHKYYKYLPNGYAQGYEPLYYVQRIRNYYSLLEKHLSRDG